MDRPLTKAADCDYKEYDRSLTEQFIHRPDDEDMISVILREVLTLQDSDDATSERVLLWAQRVR